MPANETQTPPGKQMNLRWLLIGVASALLLTGCMTAEPQFAQRIFTSEYGAISDGGYDIPAVPIRRIDRRYHRQIVRYGTDEPPGTIVVDTRRRFLYYVLPNHRAVRYGIGVGRAGFAWSGEAHVAWKRAWPRWHPPAEMVAREPDLARYAANGQAPGLMNPLGARALYLFDDNGRDTLYRLHGTPEWHSIGQAVSSGCIRLMNQDIIDLYERVQPGRDTKVVVIQ